MGLTRSVKLSRATSIWAVVTLLGILLALIPYAPSRRGGNQTRSVAPDYLDHPIYSTYEFEEADNIINVGLQPLYLPTNWIFEAVMRDTALAQALADLGLEARYYQFLNGNDISHFLQNGNLDAGVGGDMSALTIAASKNVLIPTMVQQGFTSIVANRPMLIKELKGKKIGFSYGANAHFTVLDALASEGMTEGDVKFVAMETTDMPTALHDELIDAFSSWEPTPAIALAGNPEAVVIHRSMSSGYLFFSRELVRKHPEAVKHIVAAQVRAMRWLQLDKKNFFQACMWTCRSAEPLADSFPECPNDKKMALGNADILGTTLPPFVPNNYLSKTGPLNREFNFLKSARMIPQSALWEVVAASLDRSILGEVLSNPAKYRLNNKTLAQSD